MSPRTSTSRNTQNDKINWLGHQQSFHFTGNCPCGGRITYKLSGNRPYRSSVSTCNTCGQTETAHEGG